MALGDQPMTPVTSRWPVFIFTAAVVVACLLLALRLAWPWYIDFRLRELGWENGHSGHSTRISIHRVRYTWPLQYKPAWTKVRAGNGLTVRDANDLARARHIEQLSVSGRLEPGVLASLARLPRLSRLWISSEVSPADLRSLGSCPALETIGIGYYDRKKPAIDVFQALAEIKTLRSVFVDASVTAEELEPLARLPHLQVLHVDNLAVSPGLLPIFKAMPQLQELHIGSNIEPPTIPYLLREACPNLRFIPDPFAPPTYEEVGKYQDEADPPEEKVQEVEFYDTDRTYEDKEFVPLELPDS